MEFLENINPDYVLGFCQLVTAIVVVVLLNLQRKQAKKCAGCGNGATDKAAPQRVVVRDSK
jgi:hypothetical protein